MNDWDAQRRLRAMAGAVAGREVDTERGLAELRRRRVLARRDGRRWIAAAASGAAVALIAIVLPLLAGGATGGPKTPPLSSATSRAPSTGNISLAGVPSYPRALVAQIPLAGVFSVAEDRGVLWAARLIPITRGRTFEEIAKIDLRTNRILLHLDYRIGQLALDPAAGGGQLWLTTGQGRARGQIARIDPATGRIIARLHLPVGPCAEISYISGWLWAECNANHGGQEFLRINPSTSRVDGQLPTVRGISGGLVVFTAQGAWYGTTAGISGEVGFGLRQSILVAGAANVPQYPVELAGAQSVGYNAGAVWALASFPPSVARIDPATGLVTAVFNLAIDEPKIGTGLAALAVGDGSLWFLDDASGVIRASTVTGKPLARVPGFTGEACGGPCAQLYVTASGVWVPTLRTLDRIDPSRLPH